MRFTKKICWFATITFVTANVVGCSFIADVTNDISVGASAMAENGANRAEAKRKYDYATYQEKKR